MEMILTHLVQKLWLKSPCLGGTNFFVSWATFVPIRVLGNTEGPDLGFNLTHKLHAYNLVMWYAMVIQAVKQLTKMLGTYPKSAGPKITPKGTLTYPIRQTIQTLPGDFIDVQDD